MYLSINDKICFQRKFDKIKMWIIYKRLSILLQHLKIDAFSEKSLYFSQEIIESIERIEKLEEKNNFSIHWTLL